MSKREDDFSDHSASNSMSRRRMLRQSAGLAAAGAVGWGHVSQTLGDHHLKGKAVTKGRLNQSVCFWCFEPHWDLDQTCQIVKELGCKSVEILDPEVFPTLKKHGLVCAMANSHGFVQGMNNPEYHEMCKSRIRNSIDACAEYEFPNVISFTGFREDISDEDGIKNCVDGYKEIVGYAEEKGVTICLEMLNSRVDVEMKGHPGYQGDHVDYCMEIIKQVGSPRLKLLYDIYHVQIMDGDVIRRLQENKDYIGHYHTAGNPGRRELDDQQELQYAPIMRAIAETGFEGYIGQEFIPTGDPLEGLRNAVALCDV